MKNVLRILHLEDNPADSELVKATLRSSGFRCHIQRVDTEDTFRSAIEQGGFDLILSDSVLPSLQAEAALALVKQTCPDVPLIFFSAQQEQSAIQEKLKRGATSYVSKPNIEELVHIIEQTFEKAERQKPFSRIQETLKARRSLLEKTCEAAHIGYWQSGLGAEDTLVWSNEVFHIFGVDKNNFDGKVETFFSLVHPNDLEAVVKASEFAIFDNEPYDIEHRIIKPDGTVRWVHQIGKAVHDESGNPLWLIGIIQDITNRKGAEQRIHEKAALLDQTQEAIIVQDVTGRVLFWNKGAEKLYGWSSRHAIGKSITTLLYQQQDQNAVEARQETVRQGTWSGELVQHTKNGKRITVQSRWSLMRDSEGNPKSIIMVNSEAAGKSALEPQALIANRMESMAKFAGRIAHDFNNILGPITIALDMLNKKTTDPATQRLLNTIDSSTKRGSAFTRLILSFAHGIEGEQRLFDPKPMLRHVINLLRETSPQSIQIKEIIEEKPFSILGSEAQIQQALMLLCTNALEAMLSGGTLTLQAEHIMLDAALLKAHPTAQAKYYLLLRVKDTGTGIPPAIINQIFEPFFTTKESAKDTGLGLTTVLAIVEKHVGFIEVFSEVGKETEFKIFLPVSETYQRNS